MDVIFASFQNILLGSLTSGSSSGSKIMHCYSQCTAFSQSPFYVFEKLPCWDINDKFVRLFDDYNGPHHRHEAYLFSKSVFRKPLCSFQTQFGPQWQRVSLHNNIPPNRNMTTELLKVIAYVLYFPG